MGNAETRDVKGEDVKGSCLGLQLCLLVVRRIEVRDKDLARQLRRCSVSITLNIAEGMYSPGGNRAARYHTALGSAQETLACLEAAEACGYVASVDAALVQQLRRVVGTLVKLVGV